MVPLVPHGQGYFKAADSGLWMPHSLELFEGLLDETELEVKFNPCLRWNAASAVVEEDQKKNRIFAKKKALGVLMALFRRQWQLVLRMMTMRMREISMVSLMIQ